MIESEIPVALGFLVVAQIIRSLIKRNEKASPPDLPRRVKHNPYQYFSNGNEIPNSHFRHYAQVLGLDISRKISFDDIRNAVFEKQNMINIYNEEESNESIEELKTACYFLLEQWEYSTAVN